MVGLTVSTMSVGVMTIPLAIVPKFKSIVRADISAGSTRMLVGALPSLSLFCYFGEREIAQATLDCFLVWNWQDIKGIHPVHQLM